LRPAVREMIDFASTAGIATAIVSGTSSENIAALLRAVGGVTRDQFALVTDGQDVPRGKPAPDIYLHALRKLELDAADVIAVEDNVDGVAAAQAAGITCFAYPNQNTAAHDFGTAPDVQTWRQLAVA